jgi:hypothetical protein
MLLGWQDDGAVLPSPGTYPNGLLRADKAGFDPDWSSFGNLCVTLVNPGGNPLRTHLRVDASVASNEGRQSGADLMTRKRNVSSCPTFDSPWFQGATGSGVVTLIGAPSGKKLVLDFNKASPKKSPVVRCHGPSGADRGHG